MLLIFDIEKTIAAVAYLVQREGGELDVFLAIKALYVADKDALIQWGKTITGDSFVSAGTTSDSTCGIGAAVSFSSSSY